MKTRNKFRISTLGALVFGLLALTVNASDAKRPNFLLILADDLNWHDLGFTGNKEIQTPCLDKLRGEGVWLRNMFNPATTCSPTRHALHTGLDCIRSGEYPNHTRVYDGTKNMFTYFKDRGYRVGLQAKEHVGPKPSFPYEYISKEQDDFAAFGGFVNRDKSQPWLAVFASHDPHARWDRGPKKLYDNGSHSATIVRWPGKVKPGSSNDALMEYLDVPPPFLEAAGEDPTSINTGCPDSTGFTSFEGHSFLNILLGKSDHLRDTDFAQHATVGIIGYKQPYPMRSARDTRYKYIRNLMPENQALPSGVSSIEDARNFSSLFL